jgi:hypothetical protein
VLFLCGVQLAPEACSHTVCHTGAVLLCSHTVCDPNEVKATLKFVSTIGLMLLGADDSSWRGSY